MIRINGNGKKWSFHAGQSTRAVLINTGARVDLLYREDWLPGPSTRAVLIHTGARVDSLSLVFLRF